MTDRLDVKVGDVVGDAYRVVDQIGEGGMAEIWEAEDLELGRTVALKIARPGRPAHLRAEARSMASMEHPGLPTVFGVGRHHGADFIVMERLRGLTLRELIERNATPLAIGELVDLLIAAADVLASMHRAGYCHGDLKSENVMLCSGKRVVLLDLGLMRPHSHGQDETDDFCCSPYAASPELIRRAVPDGARHLTDIYAFGILAYELLCGDPPFGGETIHELLDRQLNCDPPPMRFHRDDVPIALEQLVLTMLAKRMEERPQSMDVVAASLRSARRGLGELAAARNLSVMIVDDDPDIRLLLEACVEHAAPDAAIRSLPSGMDALAAFADSAPDLMLLDLRMPGICGVELCARLRATRAADETTIIAVSGHATAADLRQLEALGVVGFIDKKVDSEELISELVALVRAIEANCGQWVAPMEEERK